MASTYGSEQWRQLVDERYPFFDQAHQFISQKRLLAGKRHQFANQHHEYLRLGKQPLDLRNQCQISLANARVSNSNPLISITS